MKVFITFTIPLFLVFAYLQLNDPDPYLWFPLYFLVSLLALVRWFHPLPKLGVVCLVVLFLGISAYFFYQIPYWGFEVEEVRETLGLWISCLFLAILGKGSKVA